MQFFGIENTPGWDFEDQALTTALTLYERSLCPDCKTPARVAFDPDSDGWFEVDIDTVCYACAARERYMSEAKEPEPGLKIRVVDERKTMSD